MSIYFKASLQNTLNPEVGTFDNVGNKEGTFTLEDGEYYLTNNTGTSYRVYYPTKNIYSIGFTIEFDVNYTDLYLSADVTDFAWCLLFGGNNNNYWHGFGVYRNHLEYRGSTLPNYGIITSPSTWLHVKCIFNYDYDHNFNNVHTYIDNVETNKFSISNNYGIQYIDILGNSGGFASPEVKIKNIIIYDNKKHYLDTTGLTFLWSKIKSLGTSDMPYNAMYAGTFNTNSPSGDSGLTASKSNTGHSLLFGIGGTGVNRGIYDNKNGRWSVFLNDTDYIMTQCPTPPEGDSSNKLATTEWVQNELAKLRQDLSDTQEPVASAAEEKENDQ